MAATTGVRGARTEAGMKIVALADPGVRLARYDAACRAIAAAVSVDEVQTIRNQAAALRAYAKQAKNRKLEADAFEIRERAERRVGELIKAQRNSEGLATGGEHGGRAKKDGFRSNPAIQRPTLSEAGIDKNLADRARKLAAVPADQFEHRIGERRQEIETAARSSRLHVHHSSATPEHYTPPEFLESVYRVFDGIPDLDPCAETKKHPNVPAKHHFTRADNGLLRPWQGRVFLNPPYGRELPEWIDKLRAEWKRGLLIEIIALLPARTDTEWFNALTRDTDDAVVCFLFGRLTFVGNDDPAPFPSMVVYFGRQHDVFAQVFTKLGSLWQRPGRPLEWFVNHE